MWRHCFLRLGNTVDDQARYERARQRAAELKEFYSHAVIYVLVNLALFVIDLLTGDGWWFYWATIFWGLGLVIHGISTFGQIGPFSSDWEERKAREIMDRERRG
jgi:hypothetical protein